MRPLSEVFDIKKGHQLSLQDVTPTKVSPSAIAYVCRSHRNNGIAAWVEKIDDVAPFPAGSLSVCLRSRNYPLSSFVQPNCFYTTYHVAVLSPKKSMSLQEKFWWCMCIRANRFRFNFGRQANRTLDQLSVPNSVPAWVYNSVSPSYGSAAPDKKPEPINTSLWKAFPLPSLFSICQGKYVGAKQLAPGATPLISATAWNNGVSALVEPEPDWPGGQITVATNGSIGAAFYQPLPFSASRDVAVLQPLTSISPATALFLCAMLRKESCRFNYARKWNSTRLSNSSVRLPVDAQGKPDYQTMENIVLGSNLGWVLDQIV